ncbi:MAG: CUB protein, partial [Bacteroidota bacterium]
MKKILLFYLFILPTILCAQGEASNWYFGQNAGVQFDVATGNVTAVTDGSLNTLEGCASISDPNGNLLFYSDGITVWNRNHAIMVNGTGLNGDSSSTSSAIIVPKPQDPNIYYIFTVDEPHHNDGGINHGLNYTVVDMSDGIGFVDNAQKNVPLITYDTSNAQEVRFKCSEKISAVKSADCESFWVITHFLDDFYAFKVDAVGVDTNPVVSTTPLLVPITGYRRNALGYLKASPQGDKLALAHLGLTNVEGGNGPGKVMLYDFDNATGIVSNEIELYDGDAPYGVEFSPEATKLYATVGLGNSGTGNSLLLQYDLLAADIPGSQFTVHESFTFSAGAIQVGIDGKIYRAQLDFNNVNGSGRFLGVIENPEADAGLVVYNENGVLLDVTNTFTNLSRIGLPPFIQSLFATPVDIIRNGVSTTELSLCTTQDYSLIADDIPGATYTWSYNGNPLAETSFQLDLTNVTLADAGLYEVQIDPNNGECPSFGEANVSIFQLPTANPIDDQFICDDNNDGFSTLDLDALAITVLNGQDPMLFSVTFHASSGDADLNLNPLVSPYTNQTAYGAETIFVRIENNDNTTCSDIISFDFDVFDQPTANTVIDYELCDDTVDGDDTNGFATFDLSTIDTEVLAGQDAMQFNITYHENQADANDNMNVLPTTYVNTTTDGNPVFARIENVDNPNCFATVEFNVVVNPLPAILQPVALLQCDDDTDGLSDFNLAEANSLLSNDSANEIFTYYTSLADAQTATNPIPNDTAYNSTNNGQVYVRIETPSGCFRAGEVNLLVATTQIPDTFQLTYEVCDDDLIDGDNTNGVATFDFSTAETQITSLFPAGQNLTITYYENFADALAEENAISDISDHRNDASPNVQNIVVRVDSDITNACLGLGEHITLTVNPLPDLNPITDYVVCSDIANQFTFDLTIKDPEVLNGQTNIDISYHETQAEADANSNPIASPFTTFPRTIYVRAANNITGCVNTAMNFELIINENPVVTMPTDLIVCDETPFDGITAVDLNTKSSEILGTLTDVSVHYFSSQADADNNVNALASPYTNTTNPETIYARIEHGTTGCFSTTSFNIIVSEAPATNIPTALEFCDTDNDGFGIFNIRESESEVTGGVLPGQVTVTYHETEDDAENNVNPLPDTYSNINAEEQTIYIRVENVLTGCYNVEELDLIVHDSPEIAALNAVSLAECDNVGADDIAQFDLTDAATDILNGEDPATHTIRYYTTEVNALAGDPAGEINNINAYSNIPPSPQVIWVRVEDQATGCASITNLTLIVNPLPVLVQLPGLELCDAITLNDEIEVFDLTSLAEDLVNNVAGISLTYYASATDLANDTPIANPSAYANVELGVQTIFVLATDDTTGCQNTITFNITVNPLPSPTLDPNGLLVEEICDDDNDGFAATDLDALVD